MALDFQALVAGEVVSATVPIVYLNEDKVQGIFEAELSEVHYKADPAHLLEPIEIDLGNTAPDDQDHVCKRPEAGGEGRPCHNLR